MCCDNIHDMDELLNQAFDLHKQGQLGEAEKLYKELLTQSPDNIQVLDLLARIKISQKKYQEGITINKKILELDSQNENALFDIALAYKNEGLLKESIEFYNKVITLNPQNTNAHYNIAFIYADLGDVNNAIYHFNKVLEHNPNDSDTKYFVSLAYLKNRDYKKGLPFFEYRMCRESALLTQVHTYPNLMKQAKLWQGENVSDKTIYTYYEAGFGDVLMFARYLPMLQEKCKQIIFKPQVPLTELFRENFPNIHTMNYFEPEKNIHFDYHIPILSLPYALGLDETNMFISKDKYLKANPQKIKFYRDKFFNNDKFKIGIKWQGNTTYDWERVIDVKEFIKLFNIPNTKFYSFQTFEGAEKIEELKKYYDIVDIGKTLNNFSDTAGAIENLDLVICNDTSLAHIAGAIGKPCWVLLPYLYNWRWHLDLDTCDWYDSVKLFRQSEPQNWDSVFDKLYKELTDVLKKHN